MLDHALSKIDFSVGRVIYMFLRKEYNNKILVGKTGMKIDSNKDINKDHKNLPPPWPKIVIPAVRHDNLKMLTKKHNHEKLVIMLLTVGGGGGGGGEGEWLIPYHFS